MKISLMRTLDRFVGVPLCWVFGLFAPRDARTRISDGDPILIIKFFGLGSIVLAMPFLATLRHNFPNSPLYMLTFSRNEQLVHRLPYRLHSLFIDTTTPISFFRTTLKVLGSIRRARVKAVFDLEFFSKFSTLLSRMSGASIRTGFELPTMWRKRNLTHAVPLDTEQHVSQVFLSQLKLFEITRQQTDASPFLQSTPEEVVSLGEKLGATGNTRKLVVVNINAGPASLERRWPRERFAETTVELYCDDERRRFIFIGNSEERDYVDEFLQSVRELKNVVVNFAGVISIGEYIALCEISEFVLSNDSGPLHIAAATGARVIGLFGPESPTFYGPPGQATVIYGKTSCSPCLTVYNAKYFVCPYDAACMKEISVANVVHAVRNTKARYVRVS